ncbi:tetratricopeptide repeat protein [Microbulbifer thermotolerans]|uniref:tetratricopeptide repeat protein n=1 Tax=Microbulbifer thermotolerans TaxID=252514 RepID=UPI002248DD4F|nr:tetratricopeptide repeat protein [Microbulbifer thermotolerans]MCX2778161.1 tetratricopeptide repeat protein [Microbulbifer thermotolerans]MCX2782205.1 tetratricopeptide repeat protein [Microbulbifer thermotolerans]MCX2795297.1 tetratricopeptide repeat protein [Microbulbifer thermotolerans]MCX2804509.1 tetratricopeptide repeat protein [Microbulbifer thermotolerans]MCX2835216.1 tetratricopeptide repeat protein [Microbulbifer thermotolerans]
MKLTTVTRAFTRLALHTSVALPLVLAPAVSVTVLESAGMKVSFAQAQAQQKTRKVPAMRENVFKKLGKVQEAADAENWNEALAALREMEAGKAKYNGYETAQMYYFYGFVYYSMERYKEAITYYKKVLAQGAENLPVALEVGTLLTIAQLYFVTENYDQALNYLNKWFAAAEKDQITADSYALRAQAYYQKGDNGKALSDINTAVSMYEKEGKVPKENWFGLQRFLYYEKNDYKKVTSILEKLVKHYPKAEYYKQLAGMYGELKRDKDQLHMMEAAYIAGALQKEKELLNMAYLFMGNEMPYKGAKVIKKGLAEKKIKRTSKNLETLAQAYQMAQELQKSIPELEAAAQLSDKGDIYSRLAGIYLDLDKNQKAIEMGAKALKKGGIKRPDQLYIVLGMANANLKKYDAALKHLKEAKKYDRSKKFAEQWIAFVESEKKREEQLAI